MSSSPSTESPTLSTVALFVLLAILAALLAAPAALYAWQKPTVANLLALSLSFGFYVSLGLLLRGRAVLVAVGAVVLVLNLIELVHLVSFGGLISLGGLRAILYTDPTEAREFVGEHLGAIAAGLLIAPLFVALVVLKARFDRLSRRPRLAAAALATLLPAALLAGRLAVAGSPDNVYLPTRIIEHWAAWLGADPMKGTVSGLTDALAARREFQMMRAARAATPFEIVRDPPAPSELYVVVVGESSRRRNWGLYGYGRRTTPRLAEVPGLIVFRDAVSPATTTGFSLPQSFYFPSPARDGTSQPVDSFVSAFRAAGFATFWLSNQGTHRTAVGNEIRLLMNEAETIATTNFGFWNTVLDGALLAEVDHALADPAPRKLVVVHTLGSHTNYRQRFPADWATRPLEPPARAVHTDPGLSAADAEVVDDYDRTILYTDWLLSEILARVGARDRYAAVVYFSDHGQRLYDDASHAKGHGFGDLKPLDVEIPLLAWLSPEFTRLNPAASRAVAAAACRPVSTADVAASMLDLARIASPRIRPTPSLFAADGPPPERRVLTTNGRAVPYAPGAHTRIDCPTTP